MQTMLLEPLRWQERSARVAIVQENGEPKAYYQVTSPRNITRMAKGRPAEELPRILGMLSPAHHLVSAMALDKLFKVEPPDLAVNMREAFLQAQLLRHHLRKLYLLFSSPSVPFKAYNPRLTPAADSHVSQQIIDEVMDCVALAQEAATILGGRADHPLSAVAGGVSRFLKDPHYGRLSEIAEHCVEFAVRLARLVRENGLFGSGAMGEFLSLSIRPMQSLAINNESGNVSVRGSDGKEIDQIAQDSLFEKIALHHEEWSYEPFAFLKDKGWSALEAESSGSLYFVGPLARLNGANELQQPLAEEERQALVEALGPFPHFSIAAAYWSLLVEAIQAAEKMVDLCSQEKLTGPSIRTMPSVTGEVGYAVLESPRGLIAHRYKTDHRAIVEEVEILDTSAENNALLCFLARKIVDESFSKKLIPEKIKSGIEVSLLPF